jgi:hypothetical protein
LQGYCLLPKILGDSNLNDRRVGAMGNVSHLDALPSLGEVKAAASVKHNLGDSESQAGNSVDRLRRGLGKSFACSAFPFGIFEIREALFVLSASP